MKSDLRYTPSTAFDTFPWPQPSTEQRTAVACAAAAMLARRDAISAAESIGLTEMYNRVDDGAYADLAKLHKSLDEAVAVAYGWPKIIAQKDIELVAKLGELNYSCAEMPGRYQPF